MAITPQAQRSAPSGSRSIASGRRSAEPILLYLANGQQWMGPGEPQRSIVPEGTEPRAWQYPALWNTYTDPGSAKTRESGGISFGDLRALANQVHVRAAIETVKNAQCKKEWIFTVKPTPGERSTDATLRAAQEPRVLEVTEFFECPDGEHDMAEWLRLLLENMLVIDAATLYNVQTNAGKPYELEVFDGTTIFPLLAEDGRTPRPPEPAYQQWLYGMPGEKFTRDEMMYSPRNPMPGRALGFAPVEQLCLHINIALRKDLQRLMSYTDGNVPAGLLPMPEQWTPRDIETWWTSFTLFVKGLPENLVKLIPIPGGTGTPVFPSLETNKDQWEESWIRLVCFAFDISVSSLVREMNRATAETARDSVEQDGAAAYTDWIRRRLNWIIRNWFGYADIVAKPKQEMDVEAETQARIDDLKLAKGTIQVNEVRERDGLMPLKELDGRNGYFGPTGWTPFDSAIVSADSEADPNALPKMGTNVPKLGISEPEDAIPERVEAKPAAANVGSQPQRPTSDDEDYEYQSTQIDITNEVAEKVLALAATIPDDALAEKGREDHVHVTVKFGIDPGVTIDEVQSLLASESSGTLTLAATDFFGGSEEYDVVYLSVESEDLERLNKLIRDGVKTTDTQPKYVPHVTLAYVEKGRGSEFVGIDTLAGIEVSFDSVMFSDTAGELTEITLSAAEKAARKKKLSRSSDRHSFAGARAY